MFIVASIGYGINLLLAIIIIHVFLTHDIYMHAPLTIKVLGFGILGACIPLVLEFAGYKIT